MTWHQTNGIRRAIATQSHKAHILGAQYLDTGKTICGAKNPAVYVNEKHAKNPNNNVCKKCLNKLEKELR